MPASARRLIRGLLPVVVAAGAALTCDAPTGPARHMVALALQPVLGVSLGTYGLSVDQARLIVVRPPADTVATQIFNFSPDSAQITANVSVPVADTATFAVTIQLLSGGAVMFTGVDTLLVTSGIPTSTAAPIALTYKGPGQNVATIQIAPRDSGVTFDGSLPYSLTAKDSAGQPVSQFYAAWHTNGAGNTINAVGLLRAGRTRGTSWVYAHALTGSPAGAWDSTRVTVSPVPSQVQIVSGNNQSGSIGTVLAQPLVVKVLAADNLPVGNVTVQFSASAGGSANPPSAMTDALGLAQTIVTLGNTAGAVAITAKAGATAQAQFAATATQLPGVPAVLAKVAGDGQSVPAGTPVPVLPQVKVTDAFNTAVGGVAVTFAVAGGGGSVTGATTTTNASGLATVGSWTLGATAGGNALTASAPSLTPVTFTATGTGTVAPAIVLTVPGGIVPIGGQGVLLVKLSQPAPAGGVTVTVTTDSAKYVTVAAPGTIAFAAGDTLKSILLNGVAVGGTIVRATATGYTAGFTGVAVTPNVIVLQPSVSVVAGQSASLGITLVPAAPAGGLVLTLASTDTTKLKITTPTVTIPATQTTGSATIQGVAAGIVGVTATAPAPANYAPGATAVTVTAVPLPAKALLLVSGGNQSATPGTQLANPVVVKVADSLGNGVSGYAVTFAVATGGGSVGTSSTTSDASGQASTTWTLGAPAGAQTITATAAGLTGSPLTISANVSVASTTVTPKFDTLTALTGTSQLIAQARDGSGGLLTGSFTWVSRSPAVASVNAATGLVTAVTNGSTYVVATEAGGTKDSALVVVQQKLASINVSPSTKSLYLTTSFNFTANGVDGLGKPLPSNPPFTWSTTAPAVATVDTAGHVVGIGLGSAQIKATSGTIVGVANVSIITPITRIAVVVDTVGAATTDTFTLPSLGVTRRYRAVAHDTLDAVMTGILFTWQSTNGSVAVVPNITSDTISATSAANGVTVIRATAQGLASNPGALLTVSQVISSVELAPASVAIGVTGSVGLTARGKDANSRYISGGTFTYASSNPAVATVDGTGRVTGVANGIDTVTATSAAIVSNPAVVNVSGSVPAIISFGRDTLSVGRGSNTSIPILLSKPSASPVIVKLVARDTFAYWSGPAVTIPAGQTAINATLNGRNAGTTVVTASDSGGTGYASDSAVVKVTANMALALSSYGVNATDIVTTQVQLSDPSPAGGTFVTFGYGTPGIAAISPDPAFIPAGQLAADIQIRAIGSGSTTITPSAIGVNGTPANFTAYAPVLRLATTQTMLGLGQYGPGNYVYTQISTNVAIPVTLTSADTTVATVTPAITIPGGSNYAYFTVSTRGLGTTTVTPSAPGWTAATSVNVISTTPHVGTCCNNTIVNTAGIQNMTVYSEDSLRGGHYRINSLLVNVRSSDTSVMKVIDSVVTIPPGAYYTSGVRVAPSGVGGTAYLVATASGHTPDSVLYTVNGAPLRFNWSANRLGAGQQDYNEYVYTPNSVTAPLVVTLANSDTSVVGVPDSVVIPTGTNYVYFNVLGKAPGNVTIGATAPGFLPTSATYQVTTPAITACCTTTMNNYSTGGGVTVYSTDSLRSGHYRITPLQVSIASSDTTVLRVDSSSVTIAAGAYYNSQARIIPIAPGVAKITFVASGQIVLDSLTITVQTPQLRFNFGSTMLGRRQTMDPNGSGFYVYTPDSRSVIVPVTLTQKQPAVDSLRALADTILANNNYVYNDAYGLSNGTDTITASAAGYLPTTAYVTVTTPRFTTGGLPGSTTTTNPPITVTVYATDSLGTAHYVMDTVVVHVVSSDTTVLQPSQPYVRILRSAYYAQPTMTVVGPGTANITFSDSANSGYLPVTTNTMTVTGPALRFSSSSYVLGMRQTSGNAFYVYTPNSVAESLVVHLLSTGTQVATVPDSVIVPKGTNYAYFSVAGMDTVGTIQIQGTATGYTATSMNVQVTQPKFGISTSSSVYTTSPKQGITIYAEDQNGTAHYTTENVVVTLATSQSAVATIDSSTVTIPAGQYYVNSPTWIPNPTPTPGTAQLTATDSRAALYAYAQASFTVSVVQPSLAFNWGTQTLGLGQYADQSVYTPNNAIAPIDVALTHTGTARTSILLGGVPVSTVTIPAASNSVYFHIVGASVGMDTLKATTTTPPHNPGTGYTAVSLGSVNPLGSWPASLSLAGTDSVQFILYARDSTTAAHYVQDSTTFTLTPNASIQFVSGGANSAPITSIVIPPDQYYVYVWVKGVSQGTGQATISATNYVTYQTPTITVSP